MVRAEKSYGIPHSLGEHGGIECAVPNSTHTRCEMCGACYTCAGIVREVRRALGIPDGPPVDEPDRTRVERIAREALAAAGVVTAYAFSGVISVNPVEPNIYNVIVDLGEDPWLRFDVNIADPDHELRRAVLDAISSRSSH